MLCSSYSGDTEETLACFEAAEALGAQRYAATTGGALADAARAAGVPVIGLPGGLQPRHSVGYGFAVTCEVAALVGASAAIRTEIDGAAGHLEASRDALIAGAGDDRRAARRDDAADLRLRPDARSPTGGSARSTRTRSSTRSSISFPSWTTTRSSAGRRTAAARRSPPSSSPTPISTHASAAAPSSPPSSSSPRRRP